MPARAAPPNDSTRTWVGCRERSSRELREEYRADGEKRNEGYSLPAGVRGEKPGHCTLRVSRVKITAG
ncbi:MAG: hypothetical protein Kow0092_32170 [Deferrisomatales bacterium]